MVTQLVGCRLLVQLSRWLEEEAQTAPSSHVKTNTAPRVQLVASAQRQMGCCRWSPWLLLDTGGAPPSARANVTIARSAIHLKFARLPTLASVKIDVQPVIQIGRAHV